MNVRTATAAVSVRTANLPVRGLIYSVLFGVGAWGVILGAAWLVRAAIS
jgi:hypothetical protein